MTGSSPIRILTVDDHPLVREGIAGLVGVQPDMTVVAEAANGREAIQQFRTHRPDVTLMDIQMPEMNGLDALIAIRTEFPDAKVIVLTTYEGDVHILRALKAGAQGYLLKNTLHSELLHTIRAVHAGKRSLSPEVSFQVAEHVSDQALTPAEVVVLRLIAAGNANKQIADQLGITEDTVKGRVKSILAKLDANDRTHAAIIGLKRGIIELVDASAAHASPPTLKSHSRGPVGGCTRRAATTNNRVEVRVATPVFHVRRRLARHRLAADATGRRRGRSLACGPEAVERSAVAHSRRLRVAGTGGTPSHRGVMDASRWSGGRRCRDLRDPHDGRTSRWAPSSSNHRRRADDARTRPVVDRRPALRMEAHRRTSAQEVVRASAEPGTPRPKGSPASPLPSRLDHPSQVVSSTTQPSHLTHAYEPTNAPERRLWQPLRTPTIAQKQGGQ